MYRTSLLASLLLAASVVNVATECYYIEVEWAQNMEVNGIYYIVDNNVECEDRNIYRHLDRPYYMYHIDGYWIVHNNAYCVVDGKTSGLARAWDLSWTPELISFELWEERNGDNWYVNTAFDVDCYAGPSALSTVAIICISIACFLTVVALVTLPIVLCLKAAKGRSRSSTADPAPVVVPVNPELVPMATGGPVQPGQPVATTYVLAEQPPGASYVIADQPPAYQDLPQQAAPMTTKPTF